MALTVGGEGKKAAADQPVKPVPISLHGESLSPWERAGCAGTGFPSRLRRGRACEELWTQGRPALAPRPVTVVTSLTPMVTCRSACSDSLASGKPGHPCVSASPSVNEGAVPTPEGACEEEIGQRSGSGAQEGLAHACRGGHLGRSARSMEGLACACPRGHSREGPLKDQAGLQSGEWVPAGSLARCPFWSDVCFCPGDQGCLQSILRESPPKPLQAGLVRAQSVTSGPQADGTRPVMPLVL